MNQTDLVNEYIQQLSTAFNSASNETITLKAQLAIANRQIEQLIKEKEQLLKEKEILVKDKEALLASKAKKEKKEAPPVSEEFTN